MNDYRVKVTIRNDRLLSAIESMGFDSVAKFCKKFNLEYQRTTEIINGKLKPINDKGTIKKTCEELLCILGLELQEAFTERQLKGFRKHMFEARVDESQLKQMISPVKNQELKMIEKDVSLKISDLFSKYLTPREEKILRMRYGIGVKATHTYEEIGLGFQITVERTRQIEAHAIKKLQQKDSLRELASTGFFEVFEGIDTSLLKDDKLKEDCIDSRGEFEMRLSEIKIQHRRVILNIHEQNLRYLYRSFDNNNLPYNLRNKFIDDYTKNFFKINKKEFAEKFLINFKCGVKNRGPYFKKILGLLEMFEDRIDKGIDVDKRQQERLSVIGSQLLRRRISFLKMSRVNDDGTIDEIINGYGGFELKEIVTRGIYYNERKNSNT